MVMSFVDASVQKLVSALRTVPKASWNPKERWTSQSLHFLVFLHTFLTVSQNIVLFVGFLFSLRRLAEITASRFLYMNLSTQSVRLLHSSNQLEVSVLEGISCGVKCRLWQFPCSSLVEAEKALSNISDLIVNVSWEAVIAWEVNVLYWDSWYFTSTPFMLLLYATVMC